MRTKNLTNDEKHVFKESLLFNLRQLLSRGKFVF